MKKNLIKLMNKQGLFKSYYYINSPQHYKSFKELEKLINEYKNTIITK
jgi:hypothetical protein